MTAERKPPISPQEAAAEEALATRYVLGELSEEEFADFEARYATDAGFRDRYNQWAEGLGDAPSEPAVAGTGLSGLKHRLSGGEGATLLGRLGVLPAVIGALIAALLVVLVSNMGLLQGADDLTGTKTILASEAGVLIAEAEFDTEAQAILISLRDAAPASEQVFEVWLVVGEGTPVSLGVLSLTERQTALPLTPELAAALHGGALVITREPQGGAGAAGPTGEVVAAGAFAAP